MNDFYDALFAVGQSSVDGQGYPYLRAIFRDTWALMLPSQRIALLESESIRHAAKEGALGNFKPEDLVKLIREKIAKMEENFPEYEVKVLPSNQGYYCESDRYEFRTGTFENHVDAVVAGYKALHEIVSQFTNVKQPSFA